MNAGKKCADAGRCCCYIHEHNCISVHAMDGSCDANCKSKNDNKIHAMTASAVCICTHEKRFFFVQFSKSKTLHNQPELICAWAVRAMGFQVKIQLQCFASYESHAIGWNNFNLKRFSSETIFESSNSLNRLFNEDHNYFLFNFCFKWMLNSFSSMIYSLNKDILECSLDINVSINKFLVFNSKLILNVYSKEYGFNSFLDSKI